MSEKILKVIVGPDILKSSILTTENETFTYNWKIEHFSDLKMTLGQQLVSPSFTSTWNTDILFNMVFYPAGELTETLATAAAIYVHLFPLPTASVASLQSINAQVTVSISSRQRSRGLLSRMIRARQTAPNQPIEHNGALYYASFPRIIRLDELLFPGNGYIANDILNIKCEVLIRAAYNYATPRHVSDNHNLYYGILLDQQLHHDFKLIVKDRVFPVHRCVIELQSTVFQAMFRNNWMEEKNSSVVITDMEPDVMQDLLRFMYTGSAPRISEHADKLLIAADKYDVTALKVACQEEMACSLNADNVASVLALADLHGAQPLTRHAHNYILNHSDAVHLSTTYQKFVKDFPQIAARLGLVDEGKEESLPDEEDAVGGGDSNQRFKRQKTG